jgi:flagellar M-ring protein FliF
VKAGARISPQNVLAITHLVASAVEGLSPDAISVVDQRGTLLSRPKRNTGENEIPAEAGEYRETLERDLLAKINRTLEPLLGAEKFRASVAAECDLTSGEESQETYDPEKTVMLTTTKTEENSGSSTMGGLPGTASSLPRPAAKSAGSGNSMMRRSETVTYQPSKVVRHVRMPMGTLKRLSVALLIDHSVRWEQKGGKSVRSVVPPTPETLKTIQNMVAATIGFNAARGDQLVVESLPFESTLNFEAPTETQAQPVQSTTVIPFDLRDPRLWIGLGVAGFLVLAGIVVMVIKRKKVRKATVTLEEHPQLEAKDMSTQLKEQAEQKRQQLVDGQQSLKLGPVQTRKGEVLVQHLKDSIGADPAAAVGVIRTWMRED